jgi:hypothetical protein
MFKDFSGAGGHINFSTATMREGSQGMDYINGVIKKLEEKHKLHLEFYGDNSKRLSG